jgi:hypothetical protein
MRPGQNKRMRGRPNNNRRGPNPLTRSYESNGPDVKIRGNAHHVAEKYLQLARDAHTSSDPVAAENYLQHAEHYFRLIAAAQAAQLQQQNGTARAPGESEADDMDDDDDVGGLSDRFASPADRTPAPYQPQPGFSAPVQGQPQPPAQPYQERPPYEGDRQPQNDRGYQNRNDRPNNRPQDRGPRDNRPYHERQDASRDNRDSRDNRQQRDNRPREFRPYRDPNPPREQVNAADPALGPNLPSFITAPPRINAAPEGQDAPYSNGGNYSEPAPVAGMEEQPVIAAPIDSNEAAPPFSLRGRRRRPRPSFGFDSPRDNQTSDSVDQPILPDQAPAND